MSDAKVLSAPTDTSESGPNIVSRLLHFQELIIALIGVALIVYFTASSSHFATHANSITLGQTIAPTAFIALAEVFILILGEIDLSIGEVYVLSPFIVRYVADAHGGVILGIVVSLIVCCLIGLFNGVVTVVLKVPSFITTLGTVFALQGIILITSNGTQVNVSGTGRLATIMGAGSYAEIIWLVGFAAVLHVALRRSAFGLHVIAVGGNAGSARESGLKVGHLKVWCFVVCSFGGGLIGLLDGYRIGSLVPSTDGLTLMFYGVAAAVIGGTALTGGRGTMIGALIGGIVIGILQDGFNILGVNSFAYTLVLGLAVLAAMILNVQVSAQVARGAGTHRRRRVGGITLPGADDSGGRPPDAAESSPKERSTL